MINKESELRKLKQFKSLKYNWNDYNGLPINKKAIRTAKRLVKLLYPTPFVSPIGRGTIQLEWKTKNGYLEFEICENEISIYNQDKFENIIIDAQMDKFSKNEVII